MKAPFNMPGGKHFQKYEIIKLIPPHKIYVEPFVGAGSVFWAKTRSEVEVINDLDEGIWFFYKFVQEHSRPPSWVPKVETKSQFEYWKKLIPRSDDERFLKFWVLQTISFRGDRKNFAHTRAIRTKDTFFNIWIRYHKRLKGVQIHNEDFEPVVKRYDSPETFFYFDPPYESTEIDVSALTSAEWWKPLSPERLIKVLKSLKGKFILSYSDRIDGHTIFKDYNLKVLKTVKGSSRRGAVLGGRTELIVYNFDKPSPLELPFSDPPSPDALDGHLKNRTVVHSVPEVVQTSVQESGHKG